MKIREEVGLKFFVKVKQDTRKLYVASGSGFINVCTLLHILYTHVPMLYRYRMELHSVSVSATGMIVYDGF